MRRFRQDLSALFGSRGPPAVSTLASWACAALACRAYQLASHAGYAAAARTAFLLYVPALLLAYWLGAGAHAFVGDAKRSYLPGTQRLARRAVLPALLLLLPAVVLPMIALADVPLGWAWLPTVLVLEIAVAGFVAPLLPVFAAGLALLAALAGFWAGSGRADYRHGTAVLIVLLAAALALPAVVKWRRASRQDSRALRPEEQPRAHELRTGLRAWLEPAGVRGLQGHRGRRPSSQIIRTCLGGMFVHLSARQLIVGIVLLALLTLAAIGLPWLDASGWSWLISALALAAAGLISGEFLMQISRLTREGLAEAALLPGLGGPAEQRRALCRTVLLQPLLWLSVVLLLGSAGLLLKGAPLWMIAVLALCIFVVWLTYVVFALQKLLTLPSKQNSFIAEVLRVYIYIFMIYPSWNSHAYARLFHAYWWLWSIPLLIAIAIASVIGISLMQLAAAPHPFMVRGSRGRWARMRTV